MDGEKGPFLWGQLFLLLNYKDGEIKRDSPLRHPSICSLKIPKRVALSLKNVMFPFYVLKLTFKGIRFSIKKGHALNKQKEGMR